MRLSVGLVAYSPLISGVLLGSTSVIAYNNCWTDQIKFYGDHNLQILD